ncbi:MAG: LLM class flavin-dependent oxidoreductase [Nitriliruptorales bacterium]
MPRAIGSPLAAFVTPGSSLGKAAQRASIAETLGYDLVLDNHIANRDGLVSLAAYGATTSTVRLGTGVYPALLQSPLSLAQQAATLDEILRGRLVLGLGTSHRPTIEGWHGLEFPDAPVEAMREIVTVLRSLFAEGAVDFSGRHVRVGFRFMGFTPRADIPIHLAALSPAMLRLAGEVADGVILWLCDPGYVRETVVPLIAEGAEQAGRDPAEIEIIAAVTCSVAGDPGPVLTKFRRTLVPYLSLPFYRAMLARAGYGEDLERFDAGMAEGDLDRALDGVSHDMLHALAGIGTEADVRKKLDEYRDAGVTLPGVGPLTADGTLRFEQILAVAAGHDLTAATT